MNNLVVIINNLEWRKKNKKIEKLIIIDPRTIEDFRIGVKKKQDNPGKVGRSAKELGDFYRFP